MPNLDQLLQILTWVAWALFTVYAVVTFVRSWLNEGAAIAFLRLLSSRILWPLFGGVAITLLSAAVIFIPPTHIGVVISLVAPGGIRPQPMRPGLHLLIPFIESEVQYPVYWQTYTMAGRPNEGQAVGDDSIRARTSDGQEIRLDSSIIFRIDPEQVVSLHTDWQARYIDDFVRPVIRGVVRTQVSQFTVREVNSSARKDLETTLQRLLSDALTAKGLIVDQFLVRDISFTNEYAAAIEQKQVALEGQERTQHEAQQMRNLAEGERDKTKLAAEGRSQQLQIEAEGRARATLLEAQAQAAALKLIAEALRQNPNLLTYEYIQKLSPTIRTMLVPNNAPLILPLGELTQMDAVPTSTVTISDIVTPTLSFPLTTTISLSNTIQMDGQ